MKNKFKMELTWHNCATYPPEEDYNENLVITDGRYVANMIWCKYEGYYVRFGNNYIHLKADELKNSWWADIEQTVRGCKEFKQ